MSQTTILCIGDVVGPAAVSCLERHLWELRRECGADAVLVNGENAAVGNGLDVASAKALLAAGADVITSGNHIWQKKEIGDFLNREPRVIRPANYPAECPGMGYTYCDAKGYRVLVMNVLGTVFSEPLDSPFSAVERMLSREEGRYDFAVLDIHAEATGEKLALAHAFDGRITAVFGTHTHVQTADCRILPGGTGYITDLGMTGPEDSVLGVKKELIIEKLRTHMPVRFAPADGPITLCGACFTLDTDTHRAVRAAAVRKEYGA